MRLRQYINEARKYQDSGRGKKVSEDYVFSKLIDKYSKALAAHENGKVLARDITKNVEYYLIDPKQGVPRRSANTYNYYTLIIDNSKKWSRYPDRSKSIICYMDRYITGQAGYSSHVVLVEDNANIGVCSNDDMWWSFEEQLNGKTLDDLNSFIYDYFENIGANTGDTNFTVFRKSCKKADEDIKENGIHDNKHLKEALYYMGDSMRWFDKNYKSDFYQFLESVLDPRKNGFSTTTINGEWYSSVEAWTNSTSLMIRVNVFEQFKEKCRQLGII